MRARRGPWFSRTHQNNGEVLFGDPMDNSRNTPQNPGIPGGESIQDVETLCLRHSQARLPKPQPVLPGSAGDSGGASSRPPLRRTRLPGSRGARRGCPGLRNRGPPRRRGHANAPFRRGRKVSPARFRQAPKRGTGGRCTGNFSPSTTRRSRLPAIDRLEGFRPDSPEPLPARVGGGFGVREPRTRLGLHSRVDGHQTPPDPVRPVARGFDRVTAAVPRVISPRTGTAASRPPAGIRRRSFEPAATRSSCRPSPPPWRCAPASRSWWDSD